MPLEVLPVDGQDLTAHEFAVMVPLEWCGPAAHDARATAPSKSP